MVLHDGTQGMPGVLQAPPPARDKKTVGPLVVGERYTKRCVPPSHFPWASSEHPLRGPWCRGRVEVQF